MNITDITFTDLKEINDEGLILLGCGGELSEWLEGVTEQLNDDDISTSADPDIVWSSAHKLTTSGGRIDLVLVFPKADDILNVGKLAMWRLKFGSASWKSDYITNYAKHFN